MGRRLATTVEISGSGTFGSHRPPEMENTNLSGRANCAPMADGRPKPIEPSPPELIHRRGSLKPINCEAPHLVLADVPW